MPGLPTTSEKIEEQKSEQEAEEFVRQKINIVKESSTESKEKFNKENYDVIEEEVEEEDPV